MKKRKCITCKKEFQPRKKTHVLCSRKCQYKYLSKLLKGNFIPWNKGGTVTHSQKTKEKMKLSKLGKKNPMYGKKHNKKTIEKLREIRSKYKMPKQDTSIEVKIQNFLKELKIDFFTHQYIKNIEHAYQCDILIPSMNLVIECDGDYWHKYPIGKDVDHLRTKELIEKGFKVLRLWEHEIVNMKINEFYNRLQGGIKL